MLPKQRELLASSARIRCAFGGFGSGKTTVGMLAYFQHVLANPWNESYGEDEPKSLILSATFATLLGSAVATLREHIPSVLWERMSLHPAGSGIKWTNGHRTLLRSARSEFTGLNLTGWWLDECHLLKDEERFADLESRARDKKAQRVDKIVTGIPIEIAWVRSTFGMPHHYADPDRCIVHMATQENVKLRDHVVSDLVSSVGAEAAENYLAGRWHKHKDAVFPEYGPEHVVKAAVDKKRPAHVSMDVGSQAAALVGQMIDGRLHIVDELITDAVTSGETIAGVLRKGWMLVPGQSVVCLDPRSHLDVSAAVRAAVPKGVKIVQYKQGHAEYDIAYGVRCVRAALKSAAGTTRLTFDHSMPVGQRSLLTAMSSARWKPNGLQIHKDNVRDHIVDALRYLVVTLLPIKQPGKIVQIEHWR